MGFPHTPAQGYMSGRPFVCQKECAGFAGMDLEALAVLLERHPWAALAVLVLVAGFAARAAYRRADLKRRQHSGSLLRSKREQANFEPVRTVYAPRQFRRERPPKQ